MDDTGNSQNPVSTDWDNWTKPGQPVTHSGNGKPNTSVTSESNWDDWNTPSQSQPVTNSTGKPIISGASESGWDDWGVSVPTLGVTNASAASVTGPQGTASTWDDWGTPISTSTESPIYKDSGNWGTSNDEWSTPSRSFGRGAGGDRRGGGNGRGRGRGRGGRGGGGGRVPREGDWICSSSGCSANNFDHRTECFKCRTPKPEGNGGRHSSRFRTGSSISRRDSSNNDSWNTPSSLNVGASYNDNYSSVPSSNVNRSSWEASSQANDIKNDWSSWSTNTDSKFATKHSPQPTMSFHRQSWCETAESTAINSAIPESRGHGRKNKSSKRKRYSSSSSSSSSSTTTSSSSDEYYARRRKHRKHKHKRRLRHGSYESYKMSRKPRPDLDQMFKAEASTQTPRFADFEDASLQLSIVEAFETKLPLTYRFAASSRNEGGGPGVAGSVIASKKVEARVRNVAQSNWIRQVKTVDGMFVDTPKTREKVNKKWPMFQITITPTTTAIGIKEELRIEMKNDEHTKNENDTMKDLQSNDEGK